MGRNSAAYFITSKEKTHLTNSFASFHAGFTVDHASLGMSHAITPGKRCHPRLLFGVTSWAISIRKSPGFVVRTYSSYSRYN